MEYSLLWSYKCCFVITISSLVSHFVAKEYAVDACVNYIALRFWRLLYFGWSKCTVLWKYNNAENVRVNSVWQLSSMSKSNVLVPSWKFSADSADFITTVCSISVSSGNKNDVVSNVVNIRSIHVRCLDNSKQNKSNDIVTASPS